MAAAACIVPDPLRAFCSVLAIGGAVRVRLSCHNIVSLFGFYPDCSSICPRFSHFLIGRSLVGGGFLVVRSGFGFLQVGA